MTNAHVKDLYVGIKEADGTITPKRVLTISFTSMLVEVAGNEGLIKLDDVVPLDSRKRVRKNFSFDLRTGRNIYSEGILKALKSCDEIIEAYNEENSGVNKQTYNKAVSVKEGLMSEIQATIDAYPEDLSVVVPDSNEPAVGAENITDDEDPAAAEEGAEVAETGAPEEDNTSENISEDEEPEAAEETAGVAEEDVEAHDDTAGEILEDYEELVNGDHVISLKDITKDLKGLEEAIVELSTKPQTEEVKARREKFIGDRAAMLQEIADLAEAYNLLEESDRKREETVADEFADENHPHDNQPETPIHALTGAISKELSGDDPDVGKELRNDFQEDLILANRAYPSVFEGVTIGELEKPEASPEPVEQKELRDLLTDLKKALASGNLSDEKEESVMAALNEVLTDISDAVEAHPELFDEYIDSEDKRAYKLAEEPLDEVLTYIANEIYKAKGSTQEDKYKRLLQLSASNITDVVVANKDLFPKLFPPTEDNADKNVEPEEEPDEFHNYSPVRLALLGIVNKIQQLLLK